MTTYDDLLNRVALLERHLRRASEKFTWLGEYHVSDKFAKENCARLANEFWSVQERPNSTAPNTEGAT